MRRQKAEERSARRWDRRASTYDTTEAGNEVLYGMIVERSRRYLDGGDIVLDFGCGAGALTYRLAPHVMSLRGVDISSRMIEIAKTKTTQQPMEGLQFLQGSIFDEAFERESFDTIVASGVLHVLRNRHEVLVRLSELLKPGGWLLSATPCMAENQPLMKFFNLAAALANGIRILPYGRLPNASEIDKAISQGGFELHETENLPFDRRPDMAYVFSRFAAAKKRGAWDGQDVN
ncbi:MAG: class I SAM-dependent methyltransferase [Acidimicrobiia bacterium]|jgi:2-polyprenyl-3-methyl-5-hydroxy-6-metoxy-1,4-benzoquinol methylase